MSSTSRGVTVPDEEVESKTAKGPWGGKSEVTGKYADVNGIKLYYETHGTGHPLVLLHGGLGATPMFGPNLPALAKGRQVIAEDIAALIKYLKLDRPDVMGYSLGGGVAFFVALRHPELVGKLVLVSTPI